MNFIYMKNVINNCKTEHEGSVIAEVGSEHCNSEGHMTDSDEAMETCEEKRKSEIQVLKDCLVSQGRAALIPWLQQVLLAACRVKMYPDELEPGELFLLDDTVECGPSPILPVRVTAEDPDTVAVSPVETASGEQAYAKIRAGASLVQLYTGLVYEGPPLIRRIKRELAALLACDGFGSLAEAVGSEAG